jgi:hypothetical protein
MDGLLQLSPEAECSIENARIGARARIERAHSFMDRSTEAERSLRNLPPDNLRQFELKEDVSIFLQRAADDARAATEKLFNAYATEVWCAVRPNVTRFDRLLKVIAGAVETDVAFSCLGSVVRDVIADKVVEWANRSIEEAHRMRAHANNTPPGKGPTQPETQDEIKERRPKSREPRTVNAARRTPDLEVSRERLALVDALARELATIKQELSGYCTVESLKKKHPAFTLWKHIDDRELKELIDGDAFTPKAYASRLTLRNFGITSLQTLKKDRRKLRKADKGKPS